MAGTTGVGRWIVGLLLCSLFAAASWYAVRALSQAQDARDTLATLSAALQKARAEQQQLELRTAHARRIVRLLERAEALGLDPDGWMRSPFEVDTGRELDALVAADPLLKRLRLEKERIARDHDNTRGRLSAPGASETQSAQRERTADKEAETLQERVEERMRMRRQWLEAQAQYTGEAVLSLLNDLSDPSRGPLFAPDFFELTRVSADRFELRAQGIFLAPLPPGNSSAGAAP